MLKKIFRSGVSLLLVACLMLGMCSNGLVAWATAEQTSSSWKDLLAELGKLNNEDVIDYVSLGASNTNGYGILGYLPPEVTEDPLAASKAGLNVYGYLRAPEEAYPAQIAEVLKVKKENFHQLAISSMRTEEALYLLGEEEEYGYVNDAYMQWRFTGGEKWFEIAEPGGVPALREAYQGYLANADVITIDLGWNNFGVYAFNNIKTILADGTYWKEPDFSATSKVMSEEDYREIKSSILASLEKNMGSENGALKDKMGLMLDTLVYATMGAIGHFDSIVEWIYENNPDAQIVVINIQNLADDLVVEFEGTTLNLGDLYGELIDLVNLYRASESPYADRYAFADAGDVETFLDEIVVWDGDPTTLGKNMVDCFDMYDDNLYVRSIVEYMMVGQALSGLFQGFREMAAGYGLDVFKNDSKYTYEFALNRSVDELLSLNLGALDFNNPGGADEDVELYGAAVAKHLKNLRGDKANVDTYNYVFEDLLTELQKQIDDLGLNKEALQINKTQLEDAIKHYENVDGAETQVEQLKSQLAVVEQDLLRFDAVETIVPAAKADFAAKLEGVYNTYHNTLNYAYDVVATFMQYAAKINTLKVDTDSLNGFNTAASGLISIIANDFINGAQDKFYYELEENGVQTTGAPKVPEYDLDESVFADPALCAIAVLAVRYELGNSFFAHPNEKGHDQITVAVLKALVNSDADEFTDAKMELYMEVLKERYPNLYAMMMGADNIGEVDDLAIIIQILKMSNNPTLEGVDLDALEAQLRAELKAFRDAHTDEEEAKAEAACYDLYRKLITLATMATGTEYVPTEDSYYVSLGDSTITGYGLEGYIDNMQNGVNQVVPGSAHVLLAQSLYGDNWKSQFGNFCQGYLRADDLLLFLGGDVELDDYYYAEIEPNLMEGTLEATQAKFIANVEKADLISVAIGGGNFLTFAGKYVNRVVGTTPGEPYELDWERIGIDSTDESMVELQEALDLLVPIIDALGLLDQYLPEGVEIDNPAKFSRALAEGLIYGFASYNYYYSQVLERIKEINPDAQLLILGMFNPVDDWTMPITIDGEEKIVNIGGSVAKLMEAANLQTLAFALQNANTSYVDVSEAETILEAENPGKELGFNDYYSSSFQTNGKAVHASVAGHEYIAGQMAAILSRESQNRIVLAELYDLVVTYGPAAYKYAYQYADENGYIDDAVAAIDGVIAALTAIEVPGTDAFQAEVAAEIEEIIETLEKAKALLLEADVLDQASLDALLATLNEAADAMVQLLNVLEQAGVDVNQLVIIPALEQAYDILVNEVIPAVTEALEEAVKAGTEYLMEKLGEAYDALVKATIEAVKKYAPDVADAVYNYLYNNPEEVIAFFAEYGPYMMELVKEYGDEALMVVGYVLYNYGDEIAAYIVENHETILAAIVSWTEIHGENTAELIQVYAEALGLCDLVREQIAELEKELAELEKELNNKIAEMEKELADLYEQLETAVGEKKAEIEAKIAALEAEIAALKASLEAKIAEVKAAIAELKAALQEAIDSGLTKLENLKDAIANLDNKVAELIDAAEKAALGEIRKAIEAIESAMKQLDEAIADLTGEVYEELKAALKELAFYVADEIVEAVKKYFPELADAIYNYLYNNPEEVIEFVKTYGPYLLEIAEEYGDEALAVVGYIFYMYGDEIAAYVIENHDTILTDLVEWFEVHGENTAELIQVYAEALGWCDAVRDQIAELEATLNELYAALENATGEAKKAIEAEIAKVEAAIAELKAELEALIDEINAIIADVNATVEEAIANVKAAIEGLKEAVAELKAEVEKLLEEVKVAIKNEIDSVIEAVVAELEELLNKQIETLEDVVDALEEAVLKSVEELKAIVDQLVYDATHADYEIDMDSYYLAIGSDPEFAKLLAQALGLDKRYGVTDWDNVDYESILKADLITLSYNENQLSNFAFNQAFGYVADYVNVDFRNSLVAYVVETMKEVLPKMLPALSDAAINEYVAIVSAQINGTIDQLSAEYFGDATAAEMDWTTIVGSDNLGYVDAARDEMKNAFLDAGVPETYAYQIPVLDYLYENLEMLGELGELMAMFDKEIVYEMFGERANYTMEIPVADALTFAGESYAFGYAQFNVQYAETVLTINKINPDAILVLLGHYNAFQGIEFEVNGTSVNLGNIYGNFANVTSAHSFAYALLQENTIFVDISDAETVFGAYGTESETSVMDFVNAYLSDSTVTSVSEAGHEYIKEQILNALNVTRKLLGDVDGDGDVDNLDAMMVLQYDAMLITKDDLDLSVGDVDGDGDVDNVDAMLILQFDAELISAFPAEN